IPSIIGRGGATVNDLEKTLGVHIDVVPKEESSRGGEWFEMSESGNNFILEVDISKSGMDAEIHVNDLFRKHYLRRTVRRALSSRAAGVRRRRAVPPDRTAERVKLRHRRSWPRPQKYSKRNQPRYSFATCRP
ncbi:MAG: hypothetical protein LAN18_16840, partial [Acidobacteriia bacterium]|nr:hypothetical protein [Terriglobia bacterium]